MHQLTAFAGSKKNNCKCIWNKQNEDYNYFIYWM